MHEFNGIFRKMKEGASFFARILLTVLLTISVFLIVEGIKGVIISVCWNVAMTAMFGFSQITIVQAYTLAFTISCLRHDYVSSIKSDYKELKAEILNKSKKEKKAKVLSVIVIVLWALFCIFATIRLVMYSWNSIIPQLLNVELVRINFTQAFGFAYLFNLLFSTSKSHDKKAKEENANKKELAKN